ncbi:MAG: 5-formyltetrahydrofolate cyclo-ligase [Chromatiales bacterium]|jgi:5-formyltetrahydrofolate cyclo-ligase
MQPTQLRREIRNQRRQLTPQTLQRHSRQLQRLAGSFNTFRHSRRIAFYVASRGEIDPHPLMMLAFKTGKQVYLPVLRSRPSNSLWFSAYRPGDRLVNNRYGIPEPVMHSRGVVMPWSLDMVCVPLVAFDISGNRLGMGGGYYDRTFAFKHMRSHWHDPKLIGLAHEFQRVEQLQNQVWDIPLDGVITEQCIYNLQRKQKS